MEAITTTMTPTGQIVLPASMARRPRLMEGMDSATKSSDDIRNKPTKKKMSLEEFDAMLDECKTWAAEVGLTPDDITDVIKDVRRRNRNAKDCNRH